jgi:hypothetical protein
MLTVISFIKSDLKMYASTTGEQEVPVESTDNYSYTHLDNPLHKRHTAMH